MVRFWNGLLPSLLCGAGISLAMAADAEPPVAPPIPLPEAAAVPLPFEPGSYVSATALAPDEGRFTLDLLSGGAHYRRLVADGRGEARALFLVPEDAALRASGAPLVTLEPSRVVAPTQLLSETPREVPLDVAFDSPRLAQLARSLREGGATAAFWAERQAEGTPMVEAGPDPETRRVTFLWRGARQNVRLWGGPANDHVWLQRLGASDVWFHTATVPDSLRLSYAMAPDVPQFEGTPRERRVALLATVQGDPLNRAPQVPEAADAFGQISYLALGNAPEEPGLDGPLPATRGHLETLRFASEALGNSRDLTFYRPILAEGAPVLLLVFDGESFTSPRAPIPEMLDRLIATGALPPVHAVFIGNAGGDARSRELPFNEDFARVVADGIVPLAEERFGLSFERGRTALAGASYGGLASAWIAARHPERFGAFLALSGSFWAAPAGAASGDTPYLSALWSDTALPPFSAWISAGLYEAGRDGEPGILETSRDLHRVLAARGDAVTYREYAGGHDYAVWRGSLTAGLVALFRAPATGDR